MKFSYNWIHELVPPLPIPSRDREGAFFAAAFGKCNSNEQR